MMSVAIVPEPTQSGGRAYRAIAGNQQSIGKTAGEALDALTASLSQEEAGTLIVVQHLRPDRFFTAEHQARLEELMRMWREARDAGSSLPTEQQAELDALVESEVRAASERTAALLRTLEQ
jgi:hypothetical protein